MLKALEQPDHRNRKQKGEDVNFEHIIKSNQIHYGYGLRLEIEYLI